MVHCPGIVSRGTKFSPLIKMALGVLTSWAMTGFGAPDQPAQAQSEPASTAVSTAPSSQGQTDPRARAVLVPKVFWADAAAPTGHRGFCSRLVFSDDGKNLAMATTDGRVTVWDLERKRVSLQLISEMANDQLFTIARSS